MQETKSRAKEKAIRNVNLLESGQKEETSKEIKQEKYLGVKPKETKVSSQTKERVSLADKTIGIEAQEEKPEYFSDKFEVK